MSDEDLPGFERIGVLATSGLESGGDHDLAALGLRLGQEPEGADPA